MSLPDGFEVVTSEQLEDMSRNVGYVVNEFSPFCDPLLIDRRGDDLIVDRYYGQVYTSMPMSTAALYGRTAALPAFNCEQLENDGFLRVPFRRIPRCVVRSRAELEELVGRIRSVDPNLKIQYRGQAQEHLIKRSAETSQWLFGEDRIMEPSLQTSASRRTPPLETVMPEWCAAIRLFLQGKLSIADKDKIAAPDFWLFALSLAQHYGLPTAGLDVTDQLDVALFFALMKYDKPEGTYLATYTRPVKYQSRPTIYVLAPTENQQFVWNDRRVEALPRGRPDRQSAQFIHVGWGYATNACARRIVIAFYLDQDGDYGELPAVSDLFPPTEGDTFAGHLEQLYLAKISGGLGRVLDEGFYLAR
jgi:hypothetical protein